MMNCERCRGGGDVTSYQYHIMVPFWLPLHNTRVLFFAGCFCVSSASASSLSFPQDRVNAIMNSMADVVEIFPDVAVCSGLTSLEGVVSGISDAQDELNGALPCSALPCPALFYLYICVYIHFVFYNYYTSLLICFVVNQSSERIV